jgi:PAT family beta-lactamase induction signal transducer AmpG
MPWTSGKPSETSLAIQLTDWNSIFKNLIRVFFLPMSLIMGIAVFSVSIGRGFIDTILPVMTVQELGWTDSDYSQIFATSKLVSGIAGMFIGGALIDFLGKKRMITVFVSLLMLLVLALSILSFMWDQPAYVTAFIITFYILEVFLTIAIFATAMQLCWKKVAATQFTLYMAIANLGLSVGAALLGPLTSFFEYKYALLSYIVFASVMLVLIQIVNLQRHKGQIEQLDKISKTA